MSVNKIAEYIEKVLQALVFFVSELYKLVFHSLYSFMSGFAIGNVAYYFGGKFIEPTLIGIIFAFIMCYQHIKQYFSEDWLWKKLK